MKIIKINTYLPVFQGFYGSIFEADNEENEIDDINSQREAKGLEPISFDDCIFDYKSYCQKVSEECVDAIETKLKEIINKDIRIDLENLVSPREYNFVNDSINIEIELTKEAQDAIIKILKDNENAFKQFVKERYTSRSGFISNHSPYYEEWIEIIKTWDNDLLDHKLGAVLDFILKEDSYDESQLYYDLETTYVFASNYNELIEG